MKEIFEQLTELYKLKSVYRDCNVEDRKESTAEHCWSMIILADYFLENFYQDLDRVKIYRMIAYHDIAEIKFGDIPLSDTQNRKNKKELEATAMKELIADIPKSVRAYIEKIIDEYEERKTLESKFVKAIDFVDADLNCFLYRFEYKKHNYSKKFLLEHAKEKLTAFPEILAFYKELLDAIELRGDFN